MCYIFDYKNIFEYKNIFYRGLLFTEDVVGMHVEVEGTTSDTDDGSLVSLLAHGKAVLTSGKAFALPLRLWVAFFLLSTSFWHTDIGHSCCRATFLAVAEPLQKFCKNSKGFSHC